MVVATLPLLANGVLVAIILTDENHGMHRFYEVGLIPLVLFGTMPLGAWMAMKYRWIARLKSWWRRRKLRVMPPTSVPSQKEDP